VARDSPTRQANPQESISARPPPVLFPFSALSSAPLQRTERERDHTARCPLSLLCPVCDSTETHRSRSDPPLSSPLVLPLITSLLKPLGWTVVVFASRLGAREAGHYVRCGARLGSGKDGGR
jgi:hypothetical protein